MQRGNGGSPGQREGRRQGGPRNATTLISLIVYNSAFSEYNVGMSSAMAWIMFVIVMIFTAISFSTQKKWVYYSDERGDK